jgi:hypothetical protein
MTLANFFHLSIHTLVDGQADALALVSWFQGLQAICKLLPNSCCPQRFLNPGNLDNGLCVGGPVMVAVKNPCKIFLTAVTITNPSNNANCRL